MIPEKISKGGNKNVFRMAREFFENLIFAEMERLAASSAAANQSDVDEGNSSEGDIFDAIKNGLKNYKSIFGLFPFKRRTKSEDEQSVELQEHIEMAHLDCMDDGDYQGTLLRAPARGHDFRAQQLTNPTWCDACGNFIWGVYKQCLKCESK